MILNSAKLSGGRGVDAVQIVAGSLHIYGVTSLASLTFSPSSLSMIAASSSTLMSLKDLSAFWFAWECLPRSPASSRHDRAAATLALLGASVSCMTSLRVLTAIGARSVWYILCHFYTNINNEIYSSARGFFEYFETSALFCRPFFLQHLHCSFPIGVVSVFLRPSYL